MKINVFLSTVSEGKTFRREALTAFYRALQASGEDAELVTGSSYVPCDIAVVYGCPKAGRQAAETRSTLYEAHQGTFIVLETPFLGRSVFLDETGLRAFIRRVRRKKNVVNKFNYFRVGLNGVFHDTADFCNAESPPDRWERFRQEFGLELRPYRKTGSHVLIVGQIPGDASLGDLDIIAWLNATAREIKRYTDRPIVIRPHPGTTRDDFDRMSRDLVGDRQIRIDLPPQGTIYDALADCWISITYSSSSAVDSLLAGIPSCAMSPANIAWPVTNHDLSKVEDPALFAREQWLYDLCYAQWSPEEIASGQVWARLRGKARAYLEERASGRRLAVG